MGRRHYFGAQIIPLNRNRVVCLHCGKIVPIGDWPTGRRAKCSPSLRYQSLSNGAVASVSRANGRVRHATRGHAEYRMRS